MRVLLMASFLTFCGAAGNEPVLGIVSCPRLEGYHRCS
jgi:hypothetical protein